mgnify:CR=1 FL=1
MHQVKTLTVSRIVLVSATSLIACVKNGTVVGFDEFEPKQPQLLPLPRVDDPQALKNPRPDRVEPMVVSVGVPVVGINPFVPVKASGNIGEVTVVTT